MSAKPAAAATNPSASRRSSGEALRLGFGTAALATALLLSVGTARAGEPDAVARGEYVFRAAGGCSCHTDIAKGGAFLTGGRALKTPFGVFYSPNITPDPETGIGRWSDHDFVGAMREGVAPDGSHYFPVFPYPSFTRMADRDLLDLKAYLFSLTPVRKPNTDHDLKPPFGWRFTVGVWKWLYFEPGPYRPEPARSGTWNRGAYLATALGHCGECHTPRDMLGGLKTRLMFAGSRQGPERQLAPNITPDKATGIGRWRASDITYLLHTGFKPDGDDVQGLMSEIIEEGFRHLSDADLKAIAEYLLSLPPIHNELERKRPRPEPEPEPDFEFDF